MLAAVRRAAKQDRYSRRAAWLLERRNRKEFALRARHTRRPARQTGAAGRGATDTIAPGYMALAEAARRMPDLDLNRLVQCMREAGDIP